MKLNVKTAALAAFAATSINGSALAAGPEVTTQKLAENVYSMDALHYNSLVVIGEDGVLITDPANPFRAGLLKEEIAKLTDLPVSRIVMTHEHYDHVGGTDVFPNADVVAQENFEMFMDKDPLGMLPDQLDVTFKDALSINMGTTIVDLLHFGPADGIAIAVVHLPEEGIVVTSDMYAPKALTRGLFLTDSNVLGNRQILNELATWDLNYAITTHSGEMGVEHLVEGAEFHNDLYDAVYPTIEQVYQENPAGLVTAVIELGETVKLPKYESWENYKDLGEHVRKMGFAITHGG
ncbi:MBL fold metallo-hydrolase [Ruegeria arenilitoris]|uniref:MBL fold metallo-hydrolase n=1 Tax=Ruegeria arenilitoris TaxID=1173585 RepID=UPI00147FB599|nr:MBL fold metallo-hydrolase [Ruegeria arenilitoris]